MSQWMENLNNAQKEAVLATEGPVMAIAGAGSGKTRVLTRRMAHLISDLGVPAHNVLAITFTNKAADEMKGRIRDLLNISTKRMWVSTFHAMCARILRDHIAYLGYDKHFQIIDDDDVTQMIKVILKRINMDPKLVPAKRLKPHILNMKYNPSVVEGYEEPLKGYCEAVFPLYQKTLKDNNLLDFEDLLVLTITLLDNHPDIQKYYHEQFQYILVDEFQDTNNVQYDLIRLLTNKNKHIFIVGDEDQSIYAFRGANIDNIRKFQRDFPKAKKILLEQNYRSTNTILNAANQVISGNKTRIEKNLFSDRGEGEPITFFKGYTYRDETEFVAETIRRLVHEGLRYEDIAVLYRANNTSRVFEDTFIQKHIPYQVVGNLSFFKRKEIKDIIAYLRLIVNPNDDHSFIRIVNEPKRGIGAKTVEQLYAFADTEETSMFEVIDDPDNPLKSRAKSRLKAFKQLIISLRQTFLKEDFNRFMDALYEETGYKATLEDDDMGDIRYENILELKTMLHETQLLFKDADKVDVLTYMLEDIALKSQDDERKDKNVVTLMTLHAAKGLEYKVIFIVALEQGLFPLYRSLDNAKDLEEERRLMYVGMTRAMDKLYLTNAKERRIFGESAYNPDSMFLREINPKYIIYEGLNKAVSRKYTRPTDKSKTAFKTLLNKAYDLKETDDGIQKGDKVEHTRFGSGVVVSVKDDQCVIAFGKDVGIKTLMRHHQALKKIERST